jgi:hypothetical protein
MGILINRARVDQPNATPDCTKDAKPDAVNDRIASFCVKGFTEADLDRANMPEFSEARGSGSLFGTNVR